MSMPEYNSTEAPSPEIPNPSELAENAASMMNLDLVLDLPVTVSVELGRVRLAINEILQIGQGSVLELEKLAGEPLEVMVQGRPIGKGEVVVVNEKFGIRLTDIISPSERVERLG